MFDAGKRTFVARWAKLTVNRHLECLVAADNWFRQTEWSAQIEGDFFAKLAKARRQRDQYLVIQAITLADTHSEAALRLIDHYFKTKTTIHDDVRALYAKARANVSLDRESDAIQTMKEILELERVRPSHKTNTFTEFPYFVATHRISTEYDTALKTLIETEADLAFPVSRFQWHAAMSIINLERNNHELAKIHAKHAVSVASVKESGFRYHSGIGLVDERYRDTLKELRHIAA